MPSLTALTSLTPHTSRSTPSSPPMNTPMPPLRSVAAAGQATSSNSNDGDGIDGGSINNNNNNNETNLHVAALQQGTLGADDEDGASDDSVEDDGKMPAKPATPRQLDNDNSDDENEEDDAVASQEVTDTIDGQFSDDDDTWTPDTGSDEEWDSDEEDDDPSQWALDDMMYKDINMTINTTDAILEKRYIQEVKQVRHRVLKEFKASSGRLDTPTSLNTNELLNVFMQSEILGSILSFMNRALTHNKKTQITPREFEPFLRTFFWLCFYNCSISDIEKHSDSFPAAMAEVNKLRGNTSRLKIIRMKDLLGSLSGENANSVVANDSGSLYYNPVYGTDRELEKLFRDIGSHTSKLAYIQGLTDCIIDDEKLRQRSTKANDISLSRHKSSKSFGPVGNSVNSVGTGIPLSCHMSHHGESSTEIVRSNLMIISGVNNPKQIKMSGTTMGGDRGYNDKEYFDLTNEVEMEFLNTTKRGPSLAVKFGHTRYKTSREQKDIPESGPILSIGSTRAVGSSTAHLVAYRNGTGRVTLLQSSDSALSYGNFDYVTAYKDIEYGAKYSHAVRVLSARQDYDPTSLLSPEEIRWRERYNAHSVYEATKGQGGDEWRFFRPFHITSTLAYHALPRDEDEMTTEEIRLVSEDLGLKITSAEDLEVDLSHQLKSNAELSSLSNAALISICKSPIRTRIKLH